MIDDSLIRHLLLVRFPQIEAWRFEMEEFEEGDIVGATYLTPENMRARCQVDARHKDEQTIADEIGAFMAQWPDFEKAGLIQVCTNLSAPPDRGLPVKRKPGRPRKAA